MRRMGSLLFDNGIVLNRNGVLVAAPCGVRWYSSQIIPNGFAPNRRTINS